MTREQFIIDYTERSNIARYRTAEGFHVPGHAEIKAVPCDCGDDTCEGWKMDFGAASREAIGVKA